MAGEWPAYTKWVRTLPCLMRGEHTCQGDVESHHAGERGYGQRAHDDTAVPLCLLAHRGWHDASDVFKDWKKAQRRVFTELAIAATRGVFWGRGGSFELRVIPGSDSYGVTL